jgi:hypothetical protein
MSGKEFHAEIDKHLRYYDLTGMIGGNMPTDRKEAMAIAVDIARVEERLTAGLPRRLTKEEIHRCLTEVKRVMEATARFMAANFPKVSNESVPDGN